MIKLEDKNKLGDWCICCEFPTFVWNTWEECPGPKWRKQKSLLEFEIKEGDEE